MEFNHLWYACLTYVYTHITHTHAHTHTHKTHTSHIPCIHGCWINKHNSMWQTRGQAKYCEYIKTWIVIIKVDVNITLSHHNITNKQHLPSCCQNQINLAITLLKLLYTGTLTSHPVSSNSFLKLKVYYWYHCKHLNLS